MNFYPLSLSDAGEKFIENEEAFIPHYYIDKVGKPTIGFGSTKYKDGSNPKPGDTITLEAARDLLLWGADTKAKAVSYAIRNPLNQNQQDSIISFIYNIGVAGFLKSTVLKLINKNPKDPAISNAFAMWNEGADPKTKKKIILPVLVARRKRESNIYFKPV